MLPGRVSVRRLTALTRMEMMVMKTTMRTALEEFMTAAGRTADGREIAVLEAPHTLLAEVYVPLGDHHERFRCALYRWGDVWIAAVVVGGDVDEGFVNDVKPFTERQDAERWAMRSLAAFSRPFGADSDPQDARSAGPFRSA